MQILKPILKTFAIDLVAHTKSQKLRTGVVRILVPELEQLLMAARKLTQATQIISVIPFAEGAAQMTASDVADLL